MTNTSASYACGFGTVPLQGLTVGDCLRRACESWPDRDALVVASQGYRATYAQLWRQVDTVARALLGCGVRKGDRVGIWSPNRYEWVLVQFATARVGAILVNINPAYRAEELKYCVNKSGTSVLLLAPGFRQTDYRQLLDEVRDELPHLRMHVVLGEDWDSFLQRAQETSASDLDAVERTLQFDDPINIQFTSGTTGSPKGATLSHHNIVNNGLFVGESMRYSDNDRVCIPVPLYHCFGMVLGNLACVSHGAAMVLPGEAFDPAQTLACVEDERCTSLYGVPTMFIAMLKEADLSTRDLHTLRTGIMAGSPCPVETMRAVVESMHMNEVTICYGMTETSPVSTQTSPEDSLAQRVGTVGRVHPHVEVKIVDPDSGRVVPRGVAGELCTRGYSVMLGYWEDPQATAEAIDPAGWMHSGDLATMDELGYVNIVGRIKDMIIRGGENIYPREVEEFLHQHPDVQSAQVVGVPSAKYGEEVMAWIIARPGGASVCGETLAQYCRGRIATYKIPKYWKFVDSYPMTVTGKVQKYRLRQLASEQPDSLQEP